MSGFPTLGQFPVAAGQISYHGTGIPTIWSPTILEKLWARLILSEVTNGEYEGQIKNFGDNLVIREEENVTTSEFVDGQAIEYENVDVPAQVLTINRGRVWAFRQNRVSAQQMDKDMTPTWTSNASRRVQEAVERIFFAAVPAQCSAYTSGITAGAEGNIVLGTSGSPVGLSKLNIVDKIAQLRTCLSEQNVQQEGTFLILPPSGIERLVTSELKNTYVTGDPETMLRKGWRGKLCGFDIYESNLLSHAPDGQVEAYNCLFGWKKATAFAGTITENDVMDDPSYFAKLYRGLFVYGFKVVQTNAIGNLYCNFDSTSS